jgi:WD40 repeat protein
MRAVRYRGLVGSVWQWNAADGRPVRQLVGRCGGVRGVAFTPDGKRLLAAGGRSLRQWEATTGRPWPAPAGRAASALAAALAPDGATLAVGGSDGLIRLWDPATGESRGHLEGHGGPVVALAYGPGGVLASASSAVSVERRGPADRP